MKTIRPVKNDLAVVALFLAGYVFSISNVFYGLYYYIVPLIPWATATILYVFSGSGNSFVSQDSRHPIIVPLFGALIWYSTGFLFGFGLNIFAIHVLQYMVYAIHRIAYASIVEVMRNILVRRMCSSTPRFNRLLIVAVLTTLIMMPYSKIISPSTGVLPEMFSLLTYNVLLTLIAWRYGFEAQIVMGLISLFMVKVSPLLPSIIGVSKWLILSLVFLLQMTLLSAIRGKNDLGQGRSGKPVTTSRKNFAGKIVVIVDVLMFMLVTVFFLSFILGFRAVAVASNSMRPGLNRGDLVFVNTLDRDIRVNDTIIFIVGKNMIVHRVIDVYTRKGNTYYLTRGDANEDIDPWVLTDKNIIGKCIFSIPYIGYPSLYFPNYSAIL